MSTNLKEFSKSNGAGFVAGLLYILVSKLLDKKIGPRLSNIIGLVTGSVVNFVLQSYIFNCINKMNKYICGKFIASELIIMLCNQVIFLSVYRKKFNTTITRIIVAIIVSFAVSFPIRKFWVFKLPKTESFTSIQL